MKCMIRKSTDENWSLEYTCPVSSVGFTNIQYRFGSEYDYPTQFWKGTINMKNSYIILNGVKYLFKLKSS